jgi:hypothetical protein
MICDVPNKNVPHVLRDYRWCENIRDEIGLAELAASAAQKFSVYPLVR